LIFSAKEAFYKCHYPPGLGTANAAASAGSLQAAYRFHEEFVF
jgi:4'-phosphopantetheinyl transferase EntD